MNDFNVLTSFPYKKTYYLTHPWIWFKHLFINLKWAWHRATKGYCAADVCEMDEYLLHMIPAMLRDLAKGDSYPADEIFPDEEGWVKWLNELAAGFEAVQEENWKGQNQYQKEFYSAMAARRDKSPYITMTTTLTDEQFEELRKKYYERSTQLQREHNSKIVELYHTLGEFHSYLWS